MDDGTIALTAEVVGHDGRPLVLINQNSFEVNRNRIFDTGSAPRKDRSTIVLRDDDGHALEVKYVNKHSVSFTGSIYIMPKRYVTVDQKGISIVPDYPSFLIGPVCVLFPKESEGGFLEIAP